MHDPTANPRAGVRAWRWTLDIAQRPLTRYMARRVGHGVLVTVLVVGTVFLVTRVISDPARVMLPDDATVEQYRDLQRLLGLDKPVLSQLATYVGDLATFDLGQSFSQQTAVSGLIADRLPNTLLLVATAMLFAWTVGVAVGVVASLRPGTWLDQVVSSLALTGLSMPHFWLGAMLILIGAVVLGWFPSYGSGGISYLVLPALALGLPAMGRISQITRATMIDQLATQHIVTARAKGLRPDYVIVRHALRNVFVAILTICSWELVVAIAGYSIVVETVFAWPGTGQLVLQAILRQDLILVQGIVLVKALIVVTINIATDLAYRFIDPRIELA